MISVKRKVPCITCIAGITFLPGTNLLSESDFKKIVGTKYKKAFDSEIECGNMVVTSHVPSETVNVADESGMEARAAKLAQEIGSVNVNDAKQKLSVISDPYVLKAVLKNDSRKSIRDAVELRLEVITKQSKSDLSVKNVPAPLGTGSEFVGDVDTSDPETLQGTKVQTAIPAIRKRRNK